MNIFERIPENFFSILTTKLKHLHTDLLFLIYQQFKSSIYIIERDVVIDYFVEYLETYPVTNVESDEESDSLTTLPKETRLLAFHFLNKFIEHGWVELEQQPNWSYKVIIPDYAIRILDTFEKIALGYQMEFRGQVLSIFQNLTGTEGYRYIAIQQAYETTDAFLNGLRELNHNIKRYMEEMLASTSINELLHHLFVVYKERILDTHFYRLKTSEHISKYRTQIIRRTEDMLYNRTVIEEQAQLMVNDRVAKSTHEAIQTIDNWLESIAASFRNVAELENEIDSRNQKYVRAAERRISLLYNNSGNLAAHIGSILKFLSGLIRNGEGKGELPENFSQFIQLYRQEFLDIKSPSVVRSANAKIAQTPLDIIEIDEEKKLQKLKELRERTKEVKAVEQMNEFVKKALSDKLDIHISEFPMADTEDWLNAVYTVIRSTSKNSIYKVEMESDSKILVNVSVGKLPNMKVKLKEGR
ncbi:Wadjet anti-phage system protein JetA family protein [Paenibacillus sp. Marseille-Q4541]|uniref:Wadjet anti-phage system protein JetA family protein n=1 Tax=Paenibacillus sp. Marseille-Q4541 TaxID=2831522 RepID=UPI001BAB3295|nr:Wadjet anti-phage system protein JetA family protein [Paenibacillus sp. Marseille-Q4541]